MSEGSEVILKQEGSVRTTGLVLVLVMLKMLFLSFKMPLGWREKHLQQHSPLALTEPFCFKLKKDKQKKTANIDYFFLHLKKNKKTKLKQSSCVDALRWK